jgi:hypothetical protein
MIANGDLKSFQAAAPYHSSSMMDSTGGAPPESEIAIRELDRRRVLGATFIEFGWPAYWWLDYYVGLRDYLTSKTRCLLRSSHLAIFDLRT